MRQFADVPAKKPKAPYNPPRLSTYGDLSHITHGRFAGVHPDMMGKAAGKT
jgi:hypothetical protein